MTTRAFRVFLKGFTEALTTFTEEVEKQAAFAEAIATLDAMKAERVQPLQIYRPLESAYDPSTFDQDEGLPGGLICREVVVNVALDPDMRYEHKIKDGTFGEFVFPANYVRDFKDGEIKGGKCQIRVLCFGYN